MTVSHSWRNSNGCLQKMVPSLSPDEERPTKESASTRRIRCGVGNGDGNGVQPGGIDTRLRLRRRHQYLD